MVQLYDLCEMYYYSLLKKSAHKSTLYYNIPFTLARFKKRGAEIDKRYPKGTYFVIVKNGESPLKKQ